MSPRDDDPRDAHLLAALRHAPDRHVAPSAELSAAIVAAAHAAVRRDAHLKRARGDWRERLSTWFGRAHMPWAAAFATLAVGAILGLLWSTLEPPLPPAASPRADAPAPARALASPSAPVQAAAESKSLADTLAKSAPPAVAAAPSKATAEVPTLKAKEAPARDAVPQAFAGGVAESRASSTGPARTEALRRDVAEAVGAGNAAPAAAAPARAPMAALESDSASGRLRQERTADAQLLGAQRVDAGSSLDARVRAAPGDAVWRSATSSWPHGETQRHWWASVMQATQGRWQLQAGGEREPPVPWLTLTAGDRAVARLWIEDGSLWVREGDRVWRAAVGDAQLREWQEAVARW